uniref:MULE transposase domain-containing protein n=1 Tax=Plectus sambesii TaxID=2011161 RepID=A0A914VEW9_9BILA
MDFVPCAPVYAVSSHRQRPIIQYKSKRWDGTVLEFRYKSAGPKDSNILYYQCITCKILADMGRVAGEKSGVAHIKLVNGVIVTDPNNTNTPHNCGAGSNTTTAAEVLAKRYIYEERTKIRESRKRPRAAFDDAIGGVEDQFKNEYEQDVVDDIKVKLNTGYGFASKRRALTENRAYHIIKDNTLANIHESLRVTKDLLVFFAISDLELLLEVEYVLCDGNHKYNPPEFHKPGQLYTLHTIVKGECHPFLLDLMKKANQDAYRSLFDCLRQAMMARYRHLGNLPHATWLFDFEPATMGACIAVFSPRQVQGCAFHFSKVINAKCDGLGLKSYCKEKDANGVLTHQANSMKKFFKRIRYLCFLPEHLRLQFARDLLRAVPTYPSPVINAQLKEFCDYSRDSGLAPPSSATPGGWHNGLHSQMNGRHPSLSEIIGVFQSSQDSSKFRLRALRTNPLAVPKPQKAEVVRRNTLLHEEMAAFHHYFMSTPMTTYQDILNYIDRIIAIGILSQQL